MGAGFWGWEVVLAPRAGPGVESGLGAGGWELVLGPSAGPGAGDDWGLVLESRVVPGADGWEVFLVPWSWSRSMGAGFWDWEVVLAPWAGPGVESGLGAGVWELVLGPSTGPGAGDDWDLVLEVVPGGWFWSR